MRQRNTVPFTTQTRHTVLCKSSCFVVYKTIVPLHQTENVNLTSLVQCDLAVLYRNVASMFSRRLIHVPGMFYSPYSSDFVVAVNGNDCYSNKMWPTYGMLCRTSITLQCNSSWKSAYDVTLNHRPIRKLDTNWWEQNCYTRETQLILTICNIGCDVSRPIGV